MSYGFDAYELLPTYMRSSDDGTTKALVQAVADPVEWVVDWLAAGVDQVNPQLATWARLPWVAAMGGVDIDGIPDAERRAFIDDPIVHNRGNEDAIRRRVGTTLTGAKQVEIVTNVGGDPWAINVTTYATQTPDAAATEAAIRAEIPAWLVVTIVTNAAGQSYSNMASDYATYGAMSTTGKTYGTLAQET